MVESKIIAIKFSVVCCVCRAISATRHKITKKKSSSVPSVVNSFFCDFCAFLWLNLPAEEQPADLVRQIVIAHDVNLPLIECSNAVESAVDEIKQIGG